MYTLLEAFGGPDCTEQSLDFYGAIRAATYDEVIREVSTWLGRAGGGGGLT